jgi:hypothetical protein
MDERSLEAAQAFEHGLTAHGIKKGSKLRQYWAQVNGGTPFDFEAIDRQDCCDKLVDRGVDLIKDHYAAAHRIPSSGKWMVFGNNVQEEQLLEQHLDTRR